MRERADDAHALAERDRQRRVSGAAADQQDGGVARRIGVGQSGLHRSILEPPQHGDMQRPDAQGSTQARHQAIEVAASLRERQRVFRKLRLGIDGDQRNIGFSRGDLFCQRFELGVGRARHRGEDGGWLHLRDRVRGVVPAGIDHWKQVGFAERCYK